MRPQRPPMRVRGGDPSATDDHEWLLVEIERLRAAKSGTAACAVMSDVRGVLLAHMAGEESRDGLFDWLLAVSPESGFAVEQLRLQHGEIRAAVRGFPGPSAPECLASAGALADMLESHEARERALLQAALPK